MDEQRLGRYEKQRVLNQLWIGMRLGRRIWCSGLGFHLLWTVGRMKLSWKIKKLYFPTLYLPAFITFLHQIWDKLWSNHALAQFCNLSSQQRIVLNTSHLPRRVHSNPIWLHLHQLLCDEKLCSHQAHSRICAYQNRAKLLCTHFCLKVFQWNWLKIIFVPRFIARIL